jgi:hypothetical protein
MTIHTPNQIPTLTNNLQFQVLQTVPLFLTGPETNITKIIDIHYREVFWLYGNYFSLWCLHLITG